MVRLVAEDLLKGGLTLEDAAWFAQRLQEAGADAIHPDFGLGGKEKRLEPMPYPQAWRVYLAERIKHAVSIPVIAVGVIREPHMAEEILETGKADFVTLGRALIADAEWPNKALASEEYQKVHWLQRVRGCQACRGCTFALLGEPRCRQEQGCFTNKPCKGQEKSSGDQRWPGGDGSGTSGSLAWTSGDSLREERASRWCSQYRLRATWKGEAQLGNGILRI
nr:hypothetical protein [Chloroflexota bacterium]